MKSTLMKIQDTVIKYADIISKISGVDVEVVDENLYRVAGTGIFSDKINQDMSDEGYVYRYVLNSKQKNIIYNPGFEDICKNCPMCNKCTEKIEISMPIICGDKIIGVIGIVGSTQNQKDIILNNEKTYLIFLEQIADFISSKAIEYDVLENKNELLSTLNNVIEYIEQCIILLSEDNKVVAANSSAKTQLECEDIVGKYINVNDTGDYLNNSHEYKITFDNKRYFAIGHKYPLKNKTEKYSQVVLFENIKNVQKKYYQMTNTVQTVYCSNIKGNSRSTIQLKEEILKVAKSFSTVLITGESGTGKEMVATAIWKASERKDNKFVAINCAAIPDALLESELFGYVKGAFTGADVNGRIGKFELANKGVIFLDEIGDMPLYLQAKLLRVLQDRTITRIGSNQVIPLDIRIIAATNKDLKEMIKEKKFREDLYYRLNVIPIEIAPLRQRKEDIQELSVYFAQKYADLFNKYFKHIDKSVMNRLLNYRWEGNVRELENVIEFMINMMGEDGILDESTLPKELLTDFFNKGDDENFLCSNISYSTEKSVVNLKELEKNEIKKALNIYGESTQNKKEIAKALGISLATLYRKLDEYNLNNS